MILIFDICILILNPHLETAVVRAREDPAALHVNGADPGDVAVEQLGQNKRPVWQEAEGQSCQGKI